MVKDEVAKWNEGEEAGHLESNPTPQSQAEASNTLALAIDSRNFSYPMLIRSRRMFQ